MIKKNDIYNCGNDFSLYKISHKPSPIPPRPVPPGPIPPGPIPPEPKPDINDIPDYTIRYKFDNGFNPNTLEITGGEWIYKEDLSKYYGNIWDLYCENVSSWAEYYYRLDEYKIGTGKKTNPEYALPPHTLRFKFDDISVDPTTYVSEKELVWTKVDDGIYDLYCADTDWSSLLNSFLYNEYHMTKPELTQHYSIIDAGDISDVTSFEKTFRQCSGLDFICWMNTSNVTKMSSTFCGALSIKTIPVLPTQNVTTMLSMFNSLTNANHYEDSMALEHIPLIDTSNVTDMANMFQHCIKLKNVPLLNTSKVTDIHAFLNGCISLVTIPCFDTQNAENMATMLSCGTTQKRKEAMGGYLYMNIESIPKFNTSKATNMQNFVSGCVKIKTFPSLDTHNVTIMKQMFGMCFELKEVEYLDTSNVTVMTNMFLECKNLEKIPCFNTINVTDMSFMFSMYANENDYIDEETKLQYIPDFDTRNVTNFKGFAQNLNSLRELPNLDLSSATDVSFMFNNNIKPKLHNKYITEIKPYIAPKLVDSINNIFAGLTNVKTNLYAAYQLLSSLSKITSHVNVFKYCGVDVNGNYASDNAKYEREQIPEDWGGDLGKPTIIFKSSKALTINDLNNTQSYTLKRTAVDPSDFKIIDENEHIYSVVYDSTNLKCIFANCDWLIEILEFKNTIFVTSLYSAFENTNLQTIPLFNTKNVTNMSRMFFGNFSLVSLPLFNTENVESMYYMLWSCEYLEKIPDFNLNHVTNMECMCNGCYNATGAYQLYSKASNKKTPVTNYNSCFTNCGKNTQLGLEELNQIPKDWGGLLEV